MNCNVGKTEKIVRAIAGIIIIAIGIMYQSWFGAVGLVLILTAAIGWCPITHVVGINTCKPKHKLPI